MDVRVRNIDRDDFCLALHEVLEGSKRREDRVRLFFALVGPDGFFTSLGKKFFRMLSYHLRWAHVAALSRPGQAMAKVKHYYSVIN